jgi:hypothetical protein
VVVGTRPIWYKEEQIDQAPPFIFVKKLNLKEVLG